MKSLFIAGTDTGVGKSLVTGLLFTYLYNSDIETITQKWVETGSSNNISNELNSHYKFLDSNNNFKNKIIKKYKNLISPYTFKFPASPHLAAELENKNVETQKITKSFNTLSQIFDSIIVEGVGGILVPLNNKRLLIDIVEELRLPVLIVSGNKLGTINHTLLTIEVLKNRDIKIVGIIFNNLFKNTDKKIIFDNPDIIRKISKEKILGDLPYDSNKDFLYKKFIPMGEKILNFLKQENNE